MFPLFHYLMCNELATSEVVVEILLEPITILVFRRSCNSFPGIERFEIDFFPRKFINDLLIRNAKHTILELFHSTGLLLVVERKRM